MHLALVKCEDNLQGLLRSCEASVKKTAVLHINGIVASSTWIYVTHCRSKVGTFAPSTQQITTKNFNNMSSGKILFGLLAGIATGATLGILFAPEKGVETRRKISQKGEDFADELTSRFNSFVEQITERFESIQDEASRVVENGKSALEHTSAEANKMAHSAMQQVKKPNM
jgi:gas vesicle protein